MLRDPGCARARIVVADGGSHDRTRALAAEAAARDARVVLLDNPGRLQSAAVNLAAARFGAGADTLVRIDAHAEYPDRFVERLLETAARTGASAVTVAMVSRGRGCFQKAAAAAQNSVLGAGGAAHRSAAGPGRWTDHGHHALIRLSAFVEAGGYDETMDCNEDAEFDARLAAIGGRLWIEPALAITYYPRAAAGALFRQYFRYGRGRARMLARHKAPMKLRQLMPVAVAPAVGLALLFPLSPLLLAPAALWAGVCLAGGVAVGLKARGGCALLAGAPAAISHLAWSLGYWRQTLSGPRDGGVPRLLQAGALAPE